MIHPTFEEIQRAYFQNGYKFYSHKTFNLNIGGIRAFNSKSNKFDDYIFVAYYEDINKPVLHCFPATTDPGKYWLQNPLNNAGCAIVVPGQYHNAYCLGLHGRTGKSPYAALEQIGTMFYVRDNNKDDTLDFSLYRDLLKLRIHGFRANIKSNIHRASKWQIVQLIERYSAGCQVVQKPADFDMLIRLVQVYLHKGFPNSLSYTLFEESEIWT